MNVTTKRATPVNLTVEEAEEEFVCQKNRCTLSGIACAMRYKKATDAHNNKKYYFVSSRRNDLTCIGCEDGAARAKALAKELKKVGQKKTGNWGSLKKG